MALFSGITDALGLTTDPDKYSQMAQFNPYNIRSSYGSLAYDPSTRTFTSSVNPEISRLQSQFLSRMGQTSPESELGLFRQMAEPYNRAASEGLENRLFSQGRLDHSQVYEPGGAMRGLYDAFSQQDLGFQQRALANSRAEEQRLMDNYRSLFGFDTSLFNMGQGMGSLQVQGAGNAAQVGAGVSMSNNAMMKEIYDSIAQGIMGGMGGF